MIYLVHHADAVGPEVDPQRPLSPVGHAHVTRLAADVAEAGARPDIIWHSGKLRARQTAEAFRRACNPLAAFSAIRGLQPDDPPEWIRDRLMGQSQSVMLVGHMPSLPRILAVLVGGGSGSADFLPHGCIALEADGTRWREVWRRD